MAKKNPTSFTITITGELGNAEFTDLEDVRATLKRHVQKFIADMDMREDSQKYRDFNGNSVGVIKL